jgi:hypothetical protein
VLQVINTEVTNADWSKHDVALILDNLSKLGVQCNKTVVHKANRDFGSVCGNIGDSPYFFKGWNKRIHHPGPTKEKFVQAMVLHY